MKITTIYDRPRAIDCFARQLARRHVLIDIHRWGHKLRQYTVSDIQKLVGDYLADHPELIEQARAICQELHQRELARQELLRQRRLAAKQCSHSSEITNTRPEAASTTTKEFANG